MYIYTVKTCIFQIIYFSQKKDYETCYLLPFCPTFCRNKTKSLGLCHDCLRNTRDVPPFRRHRKSPRTRRAWCPRPNCTWPGCFLEKITVASNQVYQKIYKNLGKWWESQLTINLNWWNLPDFWLCINNITSLPWDFYESLPWDLDLFGVTKPPGIGRAKLNCRDGIFTGYVYTLPETNSKRH